MNSVAAWPSQDSQENNNQKMDDRRLDTEEVKCDMVDDVEDQVLSYSDNSMNAEQDVHSLMGKESKKFASKGQFGANQ